ncbi:hypothetical protein WL74_29030 [Burkholderia cepacia]|nr:hypothetical protein WK21_20025 [Burkholderia cepacia]KWE18290.1 hypothetical protein WL74_29030 [Burkholderia cepacia]
MTQIAGGSAGALERVVAALQQLQHAQAHQRAGAHNATGDDSVPRHQSMDYKCVTSPLRLDRMA